MTQSVTIKKRATFLMMSREGICFKTRGVVSLYKKMEDARSFVGYTASRKVGNAVLRNLAKRRLRSLVRECSSEILTGSCFVFIATRKTVDLKFSQLRSDFVYTLRKAKEYGDAYATS
ncbi:MAG: ribonuclease P protein component [Holosporales bacterium]|jgi:ribonuclease P protein component|nr:ribonuclease P protein component [Holosporales bacterium]